MTISPQLRTSLFLAVAILLAILTTGASNDIRDRPTDFVDLHALDPSIAIDIRYASDHNFIGHRVPSYFANKCLLTRPAAEALMNIQRELRPYGLSLKLYDCYRPRDAVDYFVKWGANPGDTLMKQDFYPGVPKDELISRGYIASPSAHSRGSTVDATIVSVTGFASITLTNPCGAIDPRALDMGTGFDCFDEAAHIHAEGLSPRERANRMLIQTLFLNAGFRPYPAEWWHFTLRNEPYPGTYFNFPVR